MSFHVCDSVVVVASTMPRRGRGLGPTRTGGIAQSGRPPRWRQTTSTRASTPSVVGSDH